jgi:predicted metal-dependent hydrolase
VGEDGITLKTPRVSKLYIENLLKEKESWIYRKLREFQSRVYIDKEIENEAAAKAYLADKIDHFSQKMGLNYSKLKFRKMKRRWGSCSSVGVITLNTYLYNAPEFQIDYVVVHELAHLVYMDHSKEFHSLVASHIPQAQDYKSFVKRFYLL